MAVLTACEPARGPAVIALAAGESGETDLELVRRAFPGLVPDALVFINDTLARGTDAESELARAYRFLGREDLVGVVGHSGSRASLAAAPLYNERGVIQLVPTGTSRALLDAGPWTFTLAPTDSVEGAAMARFIDGSLRARTATVFFLTDEYGYGLREAVVGELRRRGVQILDEVPFSTDYQVQDAGAGDVESLVHASLERGNPDVVVLAARDFLARAAVPAVLERLPGVRFVAGDGLLVTGALREDLGESLDRIHVAVFWDPSSADPISAEFVERYRRIAGQMPTHDHALTRDALHLLASAVEAAGPDPGKVREHLLSLGRDRPPFPGVTGPITFLPDRARPVHMIRADSLPST